MTKRTKGLGSGTQRDALLTKWAEFEALAFPSGVNDDLAAAAWADAWDDLNWFDEIAGYILQVIGRRQIDPVLLTPDRALEERIAALALNEPAGLPMLDYMRLLNDLVLLAASVALSEPARNEKDPPEKLVDDALAEHCEAMVSGDQMGIMEHLTLEAANQLLASPPPVGGASAPDPDSYEVLRHDPRGQDHVFTVRFNCDQSFTAVETWRAVDGEWKIVGFVFEGVSM